MDAGFMDGRSSGSQLESTALRYKPPMKVEALALLVALAGCRNSDSESNTKPVEAPSLSADGKHKVPPGYETQFKFGGKDVKLEYTWVSLESVNEQPAFRIYASGS